MGNDSIEYIKSFCAGFKSPIIIFNSKWEAVYCNKKNFVLSNTQIQDISLSDKEKIKYGRSLMLMIDGKEYYPKISVHGDLYFCELFSYDDFLEMSRNLPVYEKILPFINSIEHNISKLWGSLSSLTKKLEAEGRFDDNKQAADIQKSVMLLNASAKNAFEYANMFYPKLNDEKIDTYMLVEGIINRCNKLLSDCGRHIEFVSRIDDYFIKANQRHCITALINAIQNALLYSPVDSCPTVILTRTEIDGSPVAVLQVKNKCLVRAENGEKIPDLNFSCQRIGCGIPIIKRFTEESGGEFDMEEKNGLMVVTLRLPIVSIAKKGTIVLEQRQYSYYDTGIPDIVDLKMFEVNEMFGSL